jgi:hypothetical protein
MKARTITGVGKLYDDGNYIRDVDYNVTETEGVDARPTLTGHLHGIEWHVLNDMSGKDYVLHLRDGRAASITVFGLTNLDLPDSCRFRVNSFLEE